MVEEFSELVITTLFQCSEDIGIPQMAVHPIAVCQIAFILLKSDLYAQTGIRLLESLREYTLHTETLSYDREAVLGQIELTLANRQSGQIYSKGLIRLTAASPQGGVYPSWIAPSLLGSVHSSVGSMVEEVAAFQSLCASDGAATLTAGQALALGLRLTTRFLAEFSKYRAEAGSPATSKQKEAV